MLIFGYKNNSLINKNKITLSVKAGNTYKVIILIIKLTGQFLNDDNEQTGELYKKVIVS